MELNIDVDIPPPGRAPKRGRWPFGKMEVGHSLFAKGIEGMQMVTAIRVYQHRHQAEGWRCTVRRDGKGWRAWRIAGLLPVMIVASGMLT
jgi:hypothetical protein